MCLYSTCYHQYTSSNIHQYLALVGVKRAGLSPEYKWRNPLLWGQVQGPCVWGENQSYRGGYPEMCH